MTRVLVSVILLAGCIHSAIIGNPLAAIYAGLAAGCCLLPHGRQRRPEVDGIPRTRSMQRVLTVLLTDAEGLTALRIGELGKVPAATVHLCLDRLEMARWAQGDWGPEPTFGPRLRFYRLTATGRANALELLELAERTDPTALGTHHAEQKDRDDH